MATQAELFDGLADSFAGLAFVDPRFAGDVEAILNGFTVGQTRALLNEARSLIAQTDFSIIDTILNDPNLSAGITGPARQILRDFADGDLSLAFLGIDQTLEILAPFAAATLLVDALSGGGGGGTAPIDPIIPDFTFVGTDAFDFLTGTNLRDLLTGGFGNDTLDGGGGGDTIEGGAGADQIFGKGGSDSIEGGGGRDDVRGGGGKDTIKGGGGRDSVKGGGGKDDVNGNGGRDMLMGQGGADMIEGGGGRDTLNGGGGGDTLMGGRGSGDQLTGGAGRDFFGFARGDGRDFIRDWQDGVDRIMIEGVDDFSALSINQVGDDVVIRVLNIRIVIDTEDAGRFDAGDFLLNG